jgi:myo-inositol catabolism protein IolS
MGWTFLLAWGKAMKELKLKGGMSVHSIGMGTTGIHMDTFDSRVKVLKEGLDCGANFIDTSATYTKGTAERAVGEAIKGYDRDRLCIATKVAPENLHYNDVIESCNQSLVRLGTDYIDIFQIHWPNIRIPLSETIDAMEFLLRTECIRYVGLSNFSFVQILEIYHRLGDKLGAIQMEYNLLERSVENVIIPFCNVTNTLFIAYTPLCQGLFDNGAYSLSKVAGKYGASVHQIALQWIVRHPTTIAIPKSTSIPHMIENVSSEKFSLSKEDYDIISNNFKYNVVKISPKDIVCRYSGGYEKRIGYRTIEEAVRNENGLSPKPLELAWELLLARDMIKPIQIKPSFDCKDKWELTNGNIRYWAWVLAFGDSEPISCVILNS